MRFLATWWKWIAGTLLALVILGVGLNSCSAPAVKNMVPAVLVQQAPVCPPGLTCTPNVPAPVCPPGYNCTPQAPQPVALVAPAPAAPVAAVPQSATEIAAAAYTTLGPTPDGRKKVMNHQVQAKPGHTCSDGTAAKLVKTGSSPGFNHYRYLCPNEVRKN